jgi:hypothetical protein
VLNVKDERHVVKDRQGRTESRHLVRRSPRSWKSSVVRERTLQPEPEEQSRFTPATLWLEKYFFQSSARTTQAAVQLAFENPRMKLLTLIAVALPLSSALWTGWGGDIFNNRWAQDTSVDSRTIRTLNQHCRLPFPIGVSAAPALHNGFAYFPSWDGQMTAYSYEDCTVKWQTNITAYLEHMGTNNSYQANLTFAVSRTSPQIDGGVLYLGTLRHCLLLALDLESGSILAQVQINSHPLAMITMSPTFYAGKIFVGASSQEEDAASLPVGSYNLRHVKSALLTSWVWHRPTHVAASSAISLRCLLTTKLTSSPFFGTTP